MKFYPYYANYVHIVASCDCHVVELASAYNVMKCSYVCP